MDYTYFKNLDNNKLIFEIDNHFQPVLRKTITNILLSQANVPLAWEDVYYEFLYSVKKLIQKFDPAKNVNFKTYLCLNCRFFILNICRTFSSKNHTVMNYYHSYDEQEDFLLKDVGASENYSLSFLSDQEQKILELYLIENMSPIDIAKILNLNVKFISNKIKRLIIEVKSKIKI